MKDGDTKGLRLRVTPAGGKFWQFETRMKGKLITRSLGEWPAVSISEAQTQARTLRNMTTQGIDPREVEREAWEKREAEEAARAAAAVQAQREALTVGQAWAAYIEARRPFWGALHLADNVGMMAPGGEPKKRGKGTTTPGPLAHFAPLRLLDVTGETMHQWAMEEARTRPTRARLGLHLFNAFLNWCTERPEYAELVTANAAKNRRAREALGKPQAKKDALLKEQLPAFFQAVQGLQSAAASAYLLGLLLTGARPGELQMLRWEDVNTQWKALTIRDKDASKGGNDGTRQVPLTPYMHHLIASLPRRGDFVFSNEWGTAPISRPHRRLADACAVAGVNVTLHGLRRSFGSLSEWLELPAGVVAQIQGHKPSATAEKHYRVRPLDLLRLHHEKFEAWILEQAGVQFDAQAEPGKLRAVN
ncbi:tyrosine-type recombinase/integrase [Comamonas flocculans]|uniref:tyrosine-type recombinase/integrase n=1 Tax=Comamonas flocculans TaxID=2597701 RepID=UPI002107B5AA|nr:integrase family protein [Comamonas flocculans]